MNRLASDVRMGKNVSIYLSKEEFENVAALRTKGYSKSDAIRKVLYDKDKESHEEHKEIIDLLREIRSTPILQVGAKTPMITVTPSEEPKKLGFWSKLFKRR